MTRAAHPRRRLLAPVVSIAMLLAGWILPAVGLESEASALEPGADAVPAVLSLEPGEIRSLSVEDVERVAVGDPNVADFTVVSANEVLVQAKAAGTTNLILWDRRGQHTSNVEVIDYTAERLETPLRQLIGTLKLPDVQIKRENTKVFVIGEVASRAELDRLEQMLSAYPGVTNLVAVPPEPPPPPVLPPPLIKLSVQVLEVSRTDVERLGVKWDSAIALTEPAATDLTGSDALMKFGTSFGRTSVTATLNALVSKNRARLLAEPKLVTESGKQASSFIGVEVPIISSSSFGTTGVGVSISFRNTGVTLSMTPTADPADPDKRITTIVEAEVSDVDRSVALSVPVGTQTAAVPGFTSRRANTVVTAASGETIVIAGLLKSQDSKTMSQVPALGSMPVIGRLFRSPEAEEKQQELVITVTPELLVDAGQEVDRTLALEQALAVAEVTASVDDPRLRYALQVQDRIAKALRFPSRERESGLEGRVKLRLHLFADGTLGRAMVSESSGLGAFDAEAMKAAESQAPYSPFPTGVSERELWLEIPVIFRL